MLYPILYYNKLNYAILDHTMIYYAVSYTVLYEIKLN